MMDSFNLERRNSAPGRRFTAKPGFLLVLFSLLLFHAPDASFSQAAPALADLEAPPTSAACAPHLKLYDSPYFKICYPRRWHVIRGYTVNYAWWVFSKRKRGERFDRPYIRIIIGPGIAQHHLALQNDSRVESEREFVKATNLFKDVRGTKLNRKFWREIAVGPEFDILAWYEQIKKKQRPQFDRALDSFWVPPPPREVPRRSEDVKP